MRGQQHGRAPLARLADHGLELVLHQRVQPAGGLVEHEQLRGVGEGLHQSDLLLGALGQAAHGTIQVQTQALGQGLHGVRPTPAAQRHQVREELAGGGALGHRQLSR